MTTVICLVLYAADLHMVSLTSAASCRLASASITLFLAE